MKRLLLFLLISGIGFSQARNGRMDSSELAAKNTVTSFYKWYSSHWKKLDAFKLYRGKKSVDNPPYTIDWKVVEKYFAYIRKNIPQLGEAFIRNERLYFKQCQKDFDANPTEEIAIGFDADRFVGGQEDPALVVKETIFYKKNTWQVKIIGNKASVFVSDKHNTGEERKGVVELVKENGVWKIATMIRPVTE